MLSTPMRVGASYYTIAWVEHINAQVTNSMAAYTALAQAVRCANSVGYSNGAWLPRIVAYI